MSKILGKLIIVGFWLAVVVSAILAIFTLSVKQLLPYLDYYRPQIESNLEQITGYPVSLESIDGRLEGIDPTVSVVGLTLQADRQTAIAVDELRVRLDTLKSLFTLSPKFTYIRFVRPVVSLQESAGTWHLKGAQPTQNVSDDVGVERVLDYLAAQRNFSILEAKLLIHSEQFGDHSLTIPSTYIFQKNHQSFLKASLYLDDDNAPFLVNAKVVDPLSLFSGYRVKASIQAPMFSVPIGSALASAVPDLSSLQFGGNVWLDFHVGSGLDLQLASTKFDAVFSQGEHYQFSPSIRLRYLQKNPSLRVDVHNLVVKDQLDHSYPAANVSYEWSAVTDRSNIAFDRFDMGLAHRVSRHFLPSDWQASRLLTGLSPSGMAKNASLRLWRDNDELSFQYLSNLVSASVEGYKGIPQASNINGVFSLSEKSGYLDFSAQDSVIKFDTVYDEAWQTDFLAGHVDWQSQQNAFVVSGRDLKVHRKGALIDGGFRLEVRRGQPDWLSLDLHGQNISLVDRLTYVPPQALNESLTDWVQSAFMGKGQVDSLDVLVQSELAKSSIPHVRMKMAMTNVDVAFDKQWPVAKKVNGTFELNKAGVTVDVSSAALQDLPLSNLLLFVPISAGSANWLNLKGTINAESSLLLKTLQTTPLVNTVLSPFKTWQIKGAVDGRFDISIPLSAGLQPKVSLALNFLNNALYIGDLDLDSQIQRGRINYITGKGVTDSEFDIEAFGGEANLVLSSKSSTNDGLVVVGDLSGVADLHKVAKWRKKPGQLASRLSGLVSYSGKLLVNQSQSGQVDFTLNSDLKGGAIDLPSPIGKTASEFKPLTVKLMGHGQDLIVDQDYNAFMRSRILFRGGEFVGGEMMLNNSLPLSSNINKGLVIKGELDQLDIGQWREVIDDVSAMASTHSHEPPRPPQWLDQMDIIIDQLTLNQWNVLHNFKASFRSDKGSPMRVSSDEISFLLTDHDYGPDLHFDFLSWNTAKTASLAKAPLEPPIHVAQIPNMTLSIDQLYVNENPYGDWQVKVSRKGNQVRLDPITSHLNTGTFKGYLVWQDSGDSSHVQFVVDAKGKDLAELTGKFSKKSVVTSEKYNLNVVLNWQGHPFYFDRKSVSGHIGFDAQNGNFSQVDELPAFLKVLGIFNLGVITKRLSLDFSDVYKPGLSYDEMKGELSLNNGILVTTSPISLVSPSAEIVVKGEANIVDETLDQNMTATIPISGALPLAGLLLGTPQIAGLLFITDKLIGNQISKVTSIRYKIGGTFDKPMLTPVKYQPTEGEDNE